jgi:hypothetical protein
VVLFVCIGRCGAAHGVCQSVSGHLHATCIAQRGHKETNSRALFIARVPPPSISLLRFRSDSLFHPQAGKEVACTKKMANVKHNGTRPRRCAAVACCACACCHTCVSTRQAFSCLCHRYKGYF